MRRTGENWLDCKELDAKADATGITPRTKIADLSAHPLTLLHYRAPTRAYSSIASVNV
jgi:hypothetical protein